ncbi:Protein kinase-like domain superfamily [Arabidopsis suecica]|uniref:Transmembrane 9 superfamily member n=1 Tax=Arabidopsis suecica TaxID=45249 RepID=A0A8T1ZTT9_ARASU|nr:Protein kinase-like domain superfamily [Arabidopsis suecica]
MEGVGELLAANKVKHVPTRVKWMTNLGRRCCFVFNLLYLLKAEAIHLDIIHRDLRPENVMIVHAGKTLIAKIGNMGIARIKAAPLLSHHARGERSPGFQPREQFENEKETTAADMFALGCIMFYVISSGKHPFGAVNKRKANIRRNNCDLRPIQNFPEAYDLIQHLVDSEPNSRLIASQVLLHPFFWNYDVKLDFFMKVSDYAVEVNWLLSTELDAAIGDTSWDGKVDDIFLDHNNKYSARHANASMTSYVQTMKDYNYAKISDLLRVIRNTQHHYGRLPKDIKRCSQNKSKLRSHDLLPSHKHTIMRLPTSLLLFIGALIFSGAGNVRSDASDHRYKDGDSVPLYANKVGPFHNPSETYRYFDLPFCIPEGVKDKKEALGEVLNGDRLVSAPYKLNFREEKDSDVYCKKKLSREEVEQFRRAVEKDYYFQMYYDDLPIWGFIGKVDKESKSDPSEFKYFLYKHIQFEILYNKDRVIEINARMDPHSLVDLTEDKEVDAEFMYTVKWKETETPFEKRMDKYAMSSSLPHHLEIHWFSIINSCVTVLLLTGFLATILMRVLKNDFMKYAQDEEAADDQEETGWKYIHGDVFRFPKHKSLFAASLGSGTQLFTLTIFIFMLSLVGVFYPYNRGALFTALVVIYALTSGIAGYTASSFYCQLEGKNWVRNLLLTGGLFCGPLFLTFCFLNTVAIAYSATAALPFGTIVVIVLIWTLVTSPLLVLGGIAGKNSKAEFQAPVRTTKYPREIPPLPWYRSAIPQMAMAGFLPFSAIYIELYYIFASVWGHRIYTIYSILFIVFIILLIVTAFITVALTYFQLAAEDHEWWWRSFLCGGSTGLFIYAYCLYYYYARSDMSGFMQTSFFFGYMACICYGFFLMLGTVGFRAALLFVRHIYRSIKCE